MTGCADKGFYIAYALVFCLSVTRGSCSVPCTFRFCSLDDGRRGMRSEACRQQPMRSARPPSPQNWGISALLPIFVVLILVPTIAFASPPDPSWITGICDDADGDDIVLPDYQPIAAVAVSQQPFLSPLCLSERFLVSAPRSVEGVGAIPIARGPPSSLTSILDAASSPTLRKAPCCLDRMSKPQSSLRSITVCTSRSPPEPTSRLPSVAPGLPLAAGLRAVPLHIGGTRP